MNYKEEILAKSRLENKDKDLFVKEVEIKAGNTAAFAAVLLATLFFVVQILVGGGMNYGFYAIVFSVQATGKTFKAIRIKCKNDITFSAIYIIITLMLTSIFISDLINKSVIL